MEKEMLDTLERNLYARTFLIGNPVLTGVQAGALDSAALASAIIQYTLFPARIVRLLASAADRFPVENRIREELDRNVSEELGSETGGIPHVRILRTLLSRELGIRMDGARANAATTQFLNEISLGMTDRGSWFALGQAYALEASAVPELSMILGPALNAYAQTIGQNSPVARGSGMEIKIVSPEQALTMTLNQWMAMHTEYFEVGHRDRLRREIIAAPHDVLASNEFENGFLHVLDQMDTWWAALAC